MWRPSRIAADILAYVIEQHEQGSVMPPSCIANHFRKKPIAVKAALSSLIRHGYARYDTASGGYGMQTVIPLRHPDGTEIEGVSPLSGCRVERRPDTPVPVTICPPRHAVGETFRQRLQTGRLFHRGGTL